MMLSKYGGSSLASGRRIANVANIVLANPGRKYVVVSAFGKERSVDTKLTDQLISLARSYQSNQRVDNELVQQIGGRLDEIAGELEIDRSIVGAATKQLCERLEQTDSKAENYEDGIKAWGEETSARFLVAHFERRGVPATFCDPREFLRLSDDFGHALILQESDDLIRKKLGGIEGIAIIPGFYGATKEGTIATLPRGGSDVTGGRIAGVLRLDAYENFTDVRKIRRATCVRNALPIDGLTYHEAMGLAYMGFSVLEAEAILPCESNGVPIHVRSSFEPDQEGTWIRNERSVDEYPIAGIAYKPGFCTLTIEKSLRLRDPGRRGKRSTLSSYVLYTEWGASRAWEFPVEHVSTDVNSLSMIIPQECFTRDRVEGVIGVLAEQCSVDPRSIKPNYDPLSLIAVVGEGLDSVPYASARAAAAISRQRLQIPFQTRPSGISMIYGVHENGSGAQNAERAVRSLYREFFVDPTIGKTLDRLRPV